jgi:hypothetical protein
MIGCGARLKEMEPVELSQHQSIAKLKGRQNLLWRLTIGLSVILLLAYLLDWLVLFHFRLPFILYGLVRFLLIVLGGIFIIINLARSVTARRKKAGFSIFPLVALVATTLLMFLPFFDGAKLYFLLKKREYNKIADMLASGQINRPPISEGSGLDTIGTSNNVTWIVSEKKENVSILSWQEGSVLFIFNHSGGMFMNCGYLFSESGAMPPNEVFNFGWGSRVSSRSMNEKWYYTCILYD